MKNMDSISIYVSFSKSLLKVVVCFFLFSGFGAFTAHAAGPDTENPTVSEKQQSVTVKGIVKDKAGEPVIGANIVEKGVANGVITDFNGNFELSIRSSQAVLVVSYIGYKTQEITVGSNRTLNIIIEEDSKMVDEVVVIGYGTQRKGDVTSAISSVKADDFIVGRIKDAAELVKGKIAGLSVTQPSGDPNATSSIKLRGTTTLQGDVTPLVLVDGVEGSLTTVAPENIASIDVLKDASAAAIYGTRGANGVILITTKTGKRDSHVTTSYSGYVSLTNWYKTADFMDTNDVIYGNTNFTYGGYDTDWLKAITRKAGYTQNHSLTLEGGSKSSTYSANIMFNDTEGIMRSSASRDLKGQLDFTHYALNDIIKFNINLLYGRHTNPHNDNTYAYRQALIHNPSSPVYNEDGSYYEEFSRFQYYNPVSIQNERIGDTRSTATRLTGNITVEPIKGWQTNLMLSLRENIGTGQNYYTSKYYTQLTGKVNGSANKSSNNKRYDNMELTTKYDFSLKKHRISALAGYSYLYNVNDGFDAGNSNFPNESYLYNSIGKGSYLTDSEKTATMSSSKNDNTLVGFFGRVSYGYDNRYNAMASIRREGSSKFGDGNKWGNFSSLSLGWTISNESFMQSFTWLDNLKLRVGYGVTGVIPENSYLSLNMYNYDTAYGQYLTGSNKWESSLKIEQNPNPKLKWETTKEWNVGLDWETLGSRLNGSIDVYRKTTDDLLFDYNVPVPPNLYSTTKANVGSMRNTGIELMLNGVPVRTKDFEWSTTLTLSHNKNKLLSLSNELYETKNFHELYSGIGDPISVPTHCMEVGHALGDFWGLKSVGVDKDGFVLVEVSDGNGGWVAKPFTTDYNTESNRQRLGNGLPDVYAGWNNTFRYKNFDLSMQFTGQFGFKILNVQRAFYENNSIAYNRLKSANKQYGAVDANGAAVIDETTGMQKQVKLANSMTQGFWSDHLENGDFVKLTNLTVGYTVPLSESMRKYIPYLRVYASGQNLFCITGYSGLDPEVAVSVYQDYRNDYKVPGVDNRDKYPTVRSFTFGLNVNF